MKCAILFFATVFSFSSMNAANRYWVGGPAAWDNTAGLKWATSSNGVGGAAVPLLSDDVFFALCTHVLKGGCATNVVGYVCMLEPKEIAECITSFYKENKEAVFIEGIKEERKKFTWNYLCEQLMGL